MSRETRRPAGHRRRTAESASEESVEGTPHSGAAALTREARKALVCLREQGGERTLIRLARDVAARGGTGTPTTEEIQAAYTRLYLDQLPQLVSAGLVTYSGQDGTLRLVSGEK